MFKVLLAEVHVVNFSRINTCVDSAQSKWYVVLLQYTCQAHLVITLYMVNPCFRDSFHWPNSRDRCFGIGITLHFTPDLTTLPLIVCNTIVEDTCDSMKDSDKILKNSNIFDIWLTLET